MITKGLNTSIITGGTGSYIRRYFKDAMRFIVNVKRKIQLYIGV